MQIACVSHACAVDGTAVVYDVMRTVAGVGPQVASRSAVVVAEPEAVDDDVGAHE